MPEDEPTDITIDLVRLAQRAVQYPLLGVNITRESAMLVIVLGPATTITQGIDEAAMDDICRRWQHRMEEET
jgi:hypothetical protein